MLRDRRGVAGRPDRLRTALQQQDGAASAVDRPLDVLRTSIVALNAARQGSKLLQLGVAQAGLASPLHGDGDGLDASPGSGDVLDQLVGDFADGDLPGDLAEDPAIRGHLTPHHGGTEAPGTLDRHHRPVPRRRAAGEHHACRSRVDHALDHHGHRDTLFGKAELAAIADRLHRVQARPAAAHPPDDLRRVLDPEVRVLKTCEARLGGVLGGGRGAHCHRLLRAAAHEPLVGSGQLLEHLARQLGLFHPAAQLIEPPMSDTAPAIFWKIGAQVGLVIWQTWMSPLRTRPISSADFTTHAGPSTTPLEAANPRSSRLATSLEARSHLSRLSRVIPQSITIAGSSITSGTGPKAGGVLCLAHSAVAARRSATICGPCAGPRGGEPVDQAVLSSMIAALSS